MTIARLEMNSSTQPSPKGIAMSARETSTTGGTAQVAASGAVATVAERFENEDALVLACIEQDPAAQQQLYQTYCDQVYGLMIRMVGRENAEDLTQQVFLHLLKTLDRFAGRSKFSTWLYRVASNEALQFLRKNSKRSESSILHDPTDDRPAEIDRIDDRELLENALSQIAPELRSIFLLREQEGMSYHELALAFDIAEGTVASRLNRARRLLQESLS